MAQVVGASCATCATTKYCAKQPQTVAQQALTICATRSVLPVSVTICTTCLKDIIVLYLYRSCANYATNCQQFAHWQQFAQLALKIYCVGSIIWERYYLSF